MTDPLEPQAQPVEFGPYRLLNLLGQGGMGRVYRALRHDEQGNDEVVAVKVLDRRVTSHPDQVRALMDEARLGRLLRHPNIVATHELKKVGETFCIAMEYVEGWPLDRLIRIHRQRDEPIPLVAALSLMIEICEGLAFAHNLRDDRGEPLDLVHRDLKPANVIVGHLGEVKIMDFGTAKSRTNLYQTEDGQTRGTPRYMSPEQVMGHPLDRRSDIFALGSILHEVVMLEHCFKGDHLVSVMRRVIDRDIGTAREDVARAAAALEPIFSRCIQQDPDKRFPNVDALETELRKLRVARPPGPAVADWIRAMAVYLPQSTTGEFGGIGVPGATQTLPGEAVETLGPPGPEPDTNLFAPGLDMPAPNVPTRLPDSGRPSSVNDPTMDWSSDSVELGALAEPQQPASWSPASLERRRRHRRSVLRAMRWGAIGAVLLLSLPILPGAVGDRAGEIRDRALRAVVGLAASVGVELRLPLSGGPEEEQQESRARPSTDGPLARLEVPAEIRGASLVLGAAGVGHAAPSPSPIAVPGFEMMAHEVTVAQLSRFCSRKESPSACEAWGGAQDWQTESHPAVGLPWALAGAFCAHWNGRLPSEAEWELAARSGEGWKYPWGNEFRKGAVNYCDLGCETTYLPVTYEDDGFARTAKVGSLLRGRSPQGVHDLSGNVSEWTLDCWTPGHKDRSSWKPDRGPCAERVVRGGAWNDPHPAQASWHRAPARADEGSDDLGFRCVKGAEPYARADLIRE